MDRKTLQQYLTQAEDHIDAARRRIERQARLANELRAHGRDTAMAERIARAIQGHTSNAGGRSGRDREPAAAAREVAARKDTPPVTYGAGFVSLPVGEKPACGSIHWVDGGPG